MKKRLFAAALTLALTLSVPAMAAGLTTVTGPGSAMPYSVEVDGKLLDLSGKAPYKEGEVILVPVPAVGESLGYTVTWSAGQADKVKLDNGVVKTTVTIGEDLYFMASSKAIGMSKPSPLGAAPVAAKGVTYVPMDLFALLGNGATAKDTVISFAKEDNTMTQVPNPMKQYDTIEEAAKAAGITLGKLPNIPAAFSDVTAYTISGTMLHVAYRDGDIRITYRMEAGDRDISGDWTVYSEVKTETINGLTVTTKGDGGNISLAMWTADGYSHALSSDLGMSLETLTAMLK